MMGWRAGDVPAIVGGAWLVCARDELLSQPILGVSIDSREVKPGEVFVAIAGERFDGHDYVDRALDAGAAMAIGRRGKNTTARHADRVLVVDDPVEALGRLAAAHRDRLGSTTVIGVTGSNGKTTTCRLIHAALSGALRGVRNRRSFNNTIGAPLTLLRARRTDEFLVCEIGSNASGEVAALASIARPDIGVITSVGSAHVGGFGSVEAAMREKASIAGAVRAGGAVLAPDEPVGLIDMIEMHGVPLRRVGWSGDANVRIVGATPRCVDGRDWLGVELADGSAFEAPLLGRHNAINLALAVAVGRRMGVNDDAIRQGLRGVDMPPMRMERATVGGVKFFNDAYNANPESMRAAIETFFEMTASANRRVLILGDMLELGAMTLGAHVEALELALADGRATRVVGVGEAMTAAAGALGADDRLSIEPRAVAMAFQRIAATLAPGDAVLLKGSRGIGLERVVEALGRSRAEDFQEADTG